MNNLGQRLKSAREELSRQLGREVIAEDIADALKREGVPIERRTYGNLETGRTKTIKPAVANKLPLVLPTVTVVQLVTALGYDLDFEGIRNEGDVVLLEAYQQASDETRRIVRLALGLEPERPADERGRSLRRLAARDRQDRRGTQG